MKQFTSPRQKIGKIGEDIAVRYMVRSGIEIVEQNFTLPVGEIDIVSREKGMYLFCEVKTVYVSQNRETWPVWQNFSPAKIKKLHRTMLWYAKKHGIPLSHCELVGLCVFLDQIQRTARCEWIRPLVV